ncbi:secreted ookinete protein, putative [Plasmodium chabaudi adami]|uniref:Secreted ookinete protein, putative n=1 Tax=Plasmodium chabaudi adami TaxID=5826 RepID=A0A1D3LE57_PLACE|nr:secreted ookinete protein, putative [Plasmodium chabaudi adami]
MKFVFIFIFAIIISIFSSKNIKCFNDVNSNEQANVQEQNDKGDGSTSMQGNQNADEMNEEHNKKEGKVNEKDDKQYDAEMDSTHNNDNDMMDEELYDYDNNDPFGNDTDYTKDDEEKDTSLHNNEQMDSEENMNKAEKGEQNSNTENELKKNPNGKGNDEYNQDLIKFEKEFREVDEDSGDNITMEDIGLNLKNDADKNMNNSGKNDDPASQNENAHNKQSINKNNETEENHDWKGKAYAKENIPHDYKNEMLLGKEHESIKYFFEILTEIFIIIKLGVMHRFTNYLIPLKNIIIHKTLNKIEFVFTTILWLHKLGSEHYRDTYGFMLIILFVLALKYIINQATFKIKQKKEDDNGVFKNKSNENIYIENLLKRILYKVERKAGLEFEDNNNIDILQHILENTDNLLINSSIINKENKTIYTDMTSNINNIGVFTYVSTQALKKINYKTDVIISELTGGRGHDLGDIPDDNKTDTYKNLSINEYEEYDINKMKENFINYNEYDENYINNKLGYNMMDNHNEFQDLATNFVKKNNDYPFPNDNNNMIRVDNMIYGEPGEEERNDHIGDVVTGLETHIDKNINDNIEGNNIRRSINSSSKISGNISPYSTGHVGMYGVMPNGKNNNSNEFDENNIHSFHLKKAEEESPNSPFMNPYLNANQKTDLIESSINNSMLNHNDKTNNTNGINNLVNPNEEMDNISPPPYIYSQNINNNIRGSKEHINNYPPNFMHNKKPSIPLNENSSIRGSIQENSNYLIQGGEPNRGPIVPDMNNEEIMTNANIINNYENRPDLPVQSPDLVNNLSNNNGAFLNERENGIPNLENDNFMNKQNTFPNLAPPPFSYVTPPQQGTENISARNSKYLTQRKERQQIVATKSPFN